MHQNIYDINISALIPLVKIQRLFNFIEEMCTK